MTRRFENSQYKREHEGSQYLNERVSPREAVEALMSRELEPESA